MGIVCATLRDGLIGQPFSEVGYTRYKDERVANAAARQVAFVGGPRVALTAKCVGAGKDVVHVIGEVLGHRLPFGATELLEDIDDASSNDQVVHHADTRLRRIARVLWLGTKVTPRRRGASGRGSGACSAQRSKMRRSTIRIS